MGARSFLNTQLLHANPRLPCVIPSLKKQKLRNLRFRHPGHGLILILNVTYLDQNRRLNITHICHSFKFAITESIPNNVACTCGVRPFTLQLQVAGTRYRLEAELAQAQAKQAQMKEEHAALVSALSVEEKELHIKACKQRFWMSYSLTDHVRQVNPHCNH